jgi:hypothetical protein
MFVEQRTTPPLHEPPLRNPSNASKPNSSDLRNRAPKKSIATRGATPQGISKSGREGTNRPKRSKSESQSDSVAADIDGLVEQIQSERRQLEIPRAEKLDIDTVTVAGKCVYQCRLSDCKMQFRDKAQLKVIKT